MVFTFGRAALTEAVTIKAAGNIMVGHALGNNTVTRSFIINGMATDKSVHDYASDTRNWSDAGTANKTGFSSLMKGDFHLVFFNGIFNGINYAINGLYINRPSRNYHECVQHGRSHRNNYGWIL